MNWRFPARLPITGTVIDASEIWQGLSNVRTGVTGQVSAENCGDLSTKLGHDIYAVKRIQWGASYTISANDRWETVSAKQLAPQASAWTPVPLDIDMLVKGNAVWIGGWLQFGGPLTATGTPRTAYFLTNWKTGAQVTIDGGRVEDSGPELTTGAHTFPVNFDVVVPVTPGQHKFGVVHHASTDDIDNPGYVVVGTLFVVDLRA